MGLSLVCRRMLGLSLEKSEQCSMWDRRPLRYRQIRYAAIDAWCCLKLYQKCVEWSQKLGCNIKDLVEAQGPIRCQLPLFWKPY
uniref:3'-5' exonuclease domain-containing protein n=1 Tax=Ditylenchus dipsaci TaxID=166011 RepID=A0A915DVN0_9BILA